VSAIAKQRAIFEEFLALAEREEPVELVGGEIVYKASPTGDHGASQTKIGEVLGPFNRRPGGPRGPGGWWIMSEVEVLFAKTGEVFRPDVIGFRRDLHPERPSDWPVTARPDWVCEILSPSTARRDLGTKQRTLHAHGVPHLWIVDPEHSTLTVMRHAVEHSLRVLDAGVGDRVRAEPFDAIEIDVAEIFGIEDDEVAR
jgi:Uma2 family endonuclease